MTRRKAWIICSAVALLLSEKRRANAFETGAGSCDAGIPLKGSHILNEQLGGGPLSDKGFQVHLNGSPLDSESQNDVPLSNDHELKLVASATDTFFRGFLIRIEGDGVDTTDYLDAPEGDENISVASLCVLVEDVGGVSHTNNGEKTEATAILRLPEVAMNLAMDVTMVVQNRDGAAEWYNSRFILNAGALPGAPTISPAATTMPTLSPRPTLSPKPTRAQTPSDTNNGSSAPTSTFDTTMPSLSTEMTSSGNSLLLSRTVMSSLVVAVAVLLMI